MEPPYPGPTPHYQLTYSQLQPSEPTDQKTPFENGRFQPKKRINDPIFLILFILQVRIWLA